MSERLVLPPRVVVAAMLLMLSALVLCGVTRLTTPSDGSRTIPGTGGWDAVGIRVADADGSPLRTDDIVTAVDGRPIADYLDGRVGSSTEQHIYTVRRDGRTLSVDVRVRGYPMGARLLDAWPTLVLIVSTTGVGIFVFRRRPRLPAVQVLMLLGPLLALGAMSWTFGMSISDVIGGREAAWCVDIGGEVALAIGWSALLHLMLVFPQPSARLQRRPSLLVVVYALPFVLFVGVLALRRGGDPVANLSTELAVSSPAVPVLPVLCLLALFAAYRATPDSRSRQQLNWFVVTFGVAVFTYISVWALPATLGSDPLLPWDSATLCFVLPVVALGAATVRHHLFDIDVVVRRSLVAIALTGLLTAVYLGLVALASSAILDGRAPVAVQTVAALATAALAEPARRRINRAVNRMFYGIRDDPLMVLGNLNAQLARAGDREVSLRRVVDTLVQDLRLPYAALALDEQEAAPELYASGRRPQIVVEYPVQADGQDLGRLIVAPRTGSGSFSAAESRLLATLARQAGLDVQAVRLRHDVELARQRIVVGREEERRRLRHELHDGVGPTLAGATILVGAVRRLLPEDAAQGRATIDVVEDQLSRSTEEIRRIIEGLRPAVVDELGLVAALKDAFAAFDGSATPTAVVVKADVELRGVPVHAEVAAYRVATEAVTNALRHASARRCVVSVRTDELDLCIDVDDDGVGLAPHHAAGVGLLSMRERVTELGGHMSVGNRAERGTAVHARIPLRPR